MPAPATHRCPRCARTALEPCSYHGNTLEACPRCAGLWCRPSEWDAKRPGPYPALEAAVPADLSAPHLCGPTCRTRLHKIRVGGDVGCDLDQCPGCGGIWFDKGEWDHLDALQASDTRHAWRDKLAEMEKPTTW